MDVRLGVSLACCLALLSPALPAAAHDFGLSSLAESRSDQNAQLRGSYAQSAPQRVKAKQKLRYMYLVKVHFDRLMPGPIQDEEYDAYAVLNLKDRGSCGKACQPLKGQGNFSGRSLLGCDEESPLIPRSGETLVSGNLTRYKGPPRDVDGDGRFGDELFVSIGMLDTQSLPAFLAHSPGGFFPRKGGRFEVQYQEMACPFNSDSAPTATIAYTYTVVRITLPWCQRHGGQLFKYLCASLRLGRPLNDLNDRLKTPVPRM